MRRVQRAVANDRDRLGPSTRSAARVLREHHIVGVADAGATLRHAGEIKKGRIKSEYSAYDQEWALLGPQRNDRTMVLQVLSGSVQVMQVHNHQWFG
jgi:hypothetical protein